MFDCSGNLPECRNGRFSISLTIPADLEKLQTWKALGNYVSNLPHTYFFIVFTKAVHTWTRVIVGAGKCIFLTHITKT